ncbi:MAG: hypothetical protein SV422_11270, partial [Pseudomonadota bacterium]|nr:hypothetical protein [Pseudomonadota bacterium]
MCNKNLIVLLLTVVPGVTFAQAVRAPQTPLEWAYALNTPDIAPLVIEGPQRVPGSDVEIVFTNPRSLFEPPDWHPDD